MDCVGNEVVVKSKRGRPRKTVSMADPNIPTPSKERGRPTGSGRNQMTKLGNVDMDDMIDELEKRIANLENSFHNYKIQRLGEKTKGKEIVTGNKTVDGKEVLDSVKLTYDICNEGFAAALAVLITGASQSRQLGKNES
nr:hypothetical protein [Tanacetum cinerariifolium]